MTPELMGIISVGVLLAVLILAMIIRIETRSEKHPKNDRKSVRNTLIELELLRNIKSVWPS